jgi:ribosomal protein S14
VKVLFFAPHSALWVHAVPEAIVADALGSAGHEIVYASCGTLFRSYCIPMAAAKLTPDADETARKKVCDGCQRQDGLIRKRFALAGPTLREIVTDADETEVIRILDAAHPENVLSLTVDDVPVGRVALYQFSIRHKRINLDIAGTVWSEYLLELRNTLYALFAARRLFDLHNPDRVVVYNGLYSVNRAVCLLAEGRGIRAQFLHAGVNLSDRLQTLLLGRYDTFSYYPRLVSQWERFADLPCEPAQLSSVTDHYLHLIKSRSVFVYSAGKSPEIVSVRSRFGVGSAQKLLVATLGSYDEEVAAEMVGARKITKQPLFKTQVEWVAWLLSFVEARRDLFLVVRVHPREFPNRRDLQKSEHAELLEKALIQLPRNCAVNWPSDGLSIYDFVDETDAFLNSWSSTGKDMALLGIPTVIYSDVLPLYPSMLNFFGDTEGEYAKAIDTALKTGWNAEVIRMSYRWAVYEFLRATLPIGDSFKEYENADRSLLQKIKDRLNGYLDRDYRINRQLALYQKPRAAAQIVDVVESAALTVVDRLSVGRVKSVSVAEETRGLRAEMARLAHALYPNPAAQSQSRLYPRLMSAFT